MYVGHSGCNIDLVCGSLMKNAFEELSCFQRALVEYAGSADPTYTKDHEELSVGLEGSFGAHHVSPRTLTSKFLGHMVCVEGIVTKCKLSERVERAGLCCDQSCFLFS